MTRLQKNPPPAYPNDTAPLQTAVPYRNLPQSTQQPVPVTSAVVPSSFNELPSTNPFSPNFTPHPAPSNVAQPAFAAQLFSPVSPISEPQPVERASQPRLHAPEAQRANGNKKHVNLQRLDGKPYPGAPNHADKGPKHVKVAKDMFDGALPPVYKRQASDPTKPGDVAQAISSAHECPSCGKKCSESGCVNCGKRRSNEPAPRSTTNGSTHSRTVSTGVNSERSIASSSTAVQSSSSASGAPSCTKCGRHRRPGSLGTPSVPATNLAQPNNRVQQAGLSIQPNSTAQSPMYPQIDIIPPSTTTYRRTNTVPSPFTPYGEEQPLVVVSQAPAQPQSPPRKSESRGFRNNSIVRSLSRRLSRKEKEKDKSSAPLPSQQLAASGNQTGEQSAGRLINMISSAMQDPSPGRGQQQPYPTVAVEEPDRPGTPFSFVGERDETDTFNKKDDGTNGEYFPNQEEKLDVIPRPKSADPHHGRHLAPEDAERPQITRFKSLRVGVNRINQSISRSQSLKRLGSVKQAHHAWYVDGSDENSVPVF